MIRTLQRVWLCGRDYPLPVLPICKRRDALYHTSLRSLVVDAISHSSLALFPSQQLGFQFRSGDWVPWMDSNVPPTVSMDAFPKQPTRTILFGDGTSESQC